MQKTLTGLAALLLPLIVFWAWPVSRANAQTAVSINDISETEGDSGKVGTSFIVSLSEPYCEAGKNITVNYTAEDGSARRDDSDYEVFGDKVRFFGDLCQQTAGIQAEIYGDTRDEDDENFFVDLTDAKDGTGNDIPIDKGKGEGVIRDDDGGGGGEGGDTGGDEKTAPRLLPLCSNTPPDYKEFSAIVKECNADSSCKGKESVLGAKAGAWASGHNCCFPDAPPGFKAEGGAYMWGGCTTSNFFEFLRNIIRFLALYLATTLAAIFIAYGGFVILTSGGNASRYAEGKKAITIALIGLAIALGSFLIINTIFKVLTGGEYTTVPE